MDNAVARLNIERFCKKLYEESDATKQEIIYRLLVEEEERLARLGKAPKEEN